MASIRQVIVHDDRQGLVDSLAARFLSTVGRLLGEKDTLNVVLTGGTVANDVLAAIAASDAAAGIDWQRIEFWWGDERWVPRGHADRNEQQARDAMLDPLRVPLENLHDFPASDDGLDLDDAAVAYAAELESHAEPGSALPYFDIMFLGLGPDGHIASLFPNREEVSVEDRTVVAVRNSPKPPAERLSLTLDAINSAERVWLALSGGDKASPLGLALAGASRLLVPAAGVEARRRTVFFVDSAAAAEVPRELIADEY